MYGKVQLCYALSTSLQLLKTFFFNPFALHLPYSAKCRIAFNFATFLFHQQDCPHTAAAKREIVDQRDTRDSVAGSRLDSWTAQLDENIVVPVHRNRKLDSSRRPALHYHFLKSMRNCHQSIQLEELGLIVDVDKAIQCLSKGIAINGAVNEYHHPDTCAGVSHSE